MDLVKGSVRILKATIPDKRSAFYIGIIVAFCAVLILWARLLTFSELYSSFFVVLLFFAVIVFVCIEYYNHVAFYYRKYKLLREGIEFREGFTRVHIVSSDYEVKPLMKSYKVDIKGAAYDIDCKYLLTEDMLIFFLRKNAIGGLYIREIGLINISLDSILKTSHSNSLISKAPYDLQVAETGEHLWLNFIFSYAGLKKILIYDYHRFLTNDNLDNRDDSTK